MNESNNIKDLIPIEDRHGRKAVSARMLHAFLESKQEFANWIKNRIDKYGFIENQDFEVFDNFVKNPNGGRPQKEYGLSIGMAKELSMVEGNEKGKQARRYFIKCEEFANSVKALAIPDFSNPAEAARAWADQYEKAQSQSKRALEAEKQVLELSDTIAKIKPKADYCDLILANHATICTTSIAQNYGMSAKAFNILLRNFGIQHKVAGQWILKARFLPYGYIQSESVVIERNNGRRETKQHSKWTQKGHLFLYEELKKHGVLPLIEQNN